MLWLSCRTTQGLPAKQYRIACRALQTLRSLSLERVASLPDPIQTSGTHGAQAVKMVQCHVGASSSMCGPALSSRQQESLMMVTRPATAMVPYRYAVYASCCCPLQAVHSACKCPALWALAASIGSDPSPYQHLLHPKFALPGWGYGNKRLMRVRCNKVLSVVTLAIHMSSAAAAKQATPMHTVSPPQATPDHCNANHNHEDSMLAALL
ncbi:hypothetical protein COO60DRAFT_812781 [Scenedesmus sp. NREL 46B-D3]|nr:hypothetical protein COO60DRAFT_812781 [Scenedesmus sp. NREL 46B-D3]